MNIPLATQCEPTYENFIVCCPYQECGHLNIFNRVSDLQDLRYISFKTVVCFECQKPFNINGDRAIKIYEYLIYDCHELLEQKRYMYCILNLTQAFEAFFSRYLRITLIHRPLKQKTISFDETNELSASLYKVIQRSTFHKLRIVFVRQVIENKNLNSFAEIRDEIEQIKKQLKSASKPSNDEIMNIQDARLAELLIKLRDFDINTMRNKVVHKHAYRPTLQEAEAYIKETRNLIFRIRAILRFEFEAIPSLTPT